MTIDLDAIEMVAAHAQEQRPGPWRRWRWGLGEVTNTDDTIDCILDSSPKPEGFDDYDGGTWTGETVLETDSGYYEPRGAVAAHIALCSPDTVLAMVARIRELETVIEDAKERAQERDLMERE